MDAQGSSHRPEPPHPGGSGAGESVAWSAMSTLLAGPLLYGALGWGVDELAGTTAFRAVGVVLGFCLSLYSVYARYGRG